MTTNELLGRPIRGDISHYARRRYVEPRPIEEFIERLDAVFAYPEVESVKWRQYTPYFNDGDACEFSIRSIGVKIAGTPDDVGDYEDGYETSWDIRYYRTDEYGEAEREPLPKGLCEALIDLDNTGAFETKLLELFGDPAEVTATRDGFDVEHYDHD